MSYGQVKVRLRNRQFVNGMLLDFVTIPVEIDEFETGGRKHKVLVYGVIETEHGDFLARQLSEIKRETL